MSLMKGWDSGRYSVWEWMYLDGYFPPSPVVVAPADDVTPQPIGCVAPGAGSRARCRHHARCWIQAAHGQLLMEPVVSIENCLRAAMWDAGSVLGRGIEELLEEWGGWSARGSVIVSWKIRVEGRRQGVLVRDIVGGCVAEHAWVRGEKGEAFVYGRMEWWNWF